MSERLHEQLSALLDGELPAGEAELLLARLQRDPGLRTTLGRYTLAGDAIRVSSLEAAPQVAPVASAGFAARLSAAIEAEEQQQASVLAGLGVVEAAPAVAPPAQRVPVRGGRRTVARRWLRPLGGVAVAASVAGLALMAMPRGPGGAPPALVASAVQSSAVQSLAVPSTAAPAMSAGVSAAAPVMAPVLAPAAALTAASAPVLVAATDSARLASSARLGEPASYTTPLSPGGQAPTFIPAAELASYVVAHSEVSGPLARRNVLTGLAAEPVSVPVTAVEPRKP